MYGYNGCFGGPGGGFFMILPVLLIIALVLYLVLRPHRKGHYHDGTSSYQADALEVLKLRYAKGEINDAEFAAKKEQILR